MYKGFDDKAFKNWMCQEFNLDTSKDTYVFAIVDSIIAYGHKWEQVSKDQFAQYIATMLPEVDFLDVARFCEDGNLSNDTLAMLGRERKVRI